jgi:hypothetical protein
MDQNLLHSWGFEALTSHTQARCSTDYTNVSHRISSPIHWFDAMEKAVRRYRKIHREKICYGNSRETPRKNPYRKRCNGKGHEMPRKNT